jgi:hypothetical protein
MVYEMREDGLHGSGPRRASGASPGNGNRRRMRKRKLGITFTAYVAEHEEGEDPGDLIPDRFSGAALCRRRISRVLFLIDWACLFPEGPGRACQLEDIGPDLHA